MPVSREKGTAPIAFPPLSFARSLYAAMMDSLDGFGILGVVDSAV
jgi:hypothetical protein